MATLFGLYPFLLKLYADGGYSGAAFQKAAKRGIAKLDVEIVRRSAAAGGFVILPGAGLSKEPSHGSNAAEGSQEIGNASTAKPAHSSALPQSASCSESFAIPHDSPDRL